jgi:hypothetical protein
MTVNLQVLQDDDLDLIEDQTGVTQSGSYGLVWGNVADAVSVSPLSGVQVIALNDAGLSAGSPIYLGTDGA